jgi:hypothetical protein
MRCGYGIVRRSRRAANAKPVLSERELQLCAECHRTRYEHDHGAFPDHDFVERAGPTPNLKLGNSTQSRKE